MIKQMELLLVEDDARVAELTKRGLEEIGYTVSTAYDGLMGEKMAKQKDFDLIILDVMLPHMDGLTLCKHIRAMQPNVPIIMLTALGTTDDKVEGFDAGADDYLVKPFELRELLARVKALLKRSATSPGHTSDILIYHDLEMNNHTKEVKRNNTTIELTPKEFKFLQYFMENPERVLSRTEIASNVWDTHFDTGTNFIDVYVNYLRKKVDKGFPQKLIHTKPGMGFILKADAL